MAIKIISCLILVLTFISHGSSLMCYMCSPSMPGCNDPYNWRGMGYLGTSCPEDNDICVKIIERKGADTMITRNCLSNLIPIRTDIPTDHYEGCRSSSPDLLLAHYVNNSIKEYDVKRNYYDSTTFCFCFLDHRCNSSTTASVSMMAFLVLTAAASLFKEYFSSA